MYVREDMMFRCLVWIVQKSQNGMYANANDDCENYANILCIEFKRKNLASQISGKNYPTPQLI